MKHTRALVALFLLAPLAACQKPQVATQGARGIEASYSMGTLTAMLPSEARCPAVIAAAEQAARSRGYTIVSTSSTDEHARLICRPPRSDSFPRLVVDAWRNGEGTRTILDWQPMGDQELCRSMLDAILQRLGL